MQLNSWPCKMREVDVKMGFDRTKRATRSVRLRPKYGCSKLNFDGGMDKHRGQCGMGMVIRGWNGKFVAARAIGRQHLTDSFVVEAMAASDGFLFARELGLDAILVEGDSQHLVQLVQRRMQGRPSGGWGDCSRYLTASRWVFWCRVFLCHEEW